MVKSFKELLLEIGRTDKQIKHGYGDFYDIWFKDKRFEKVNILEIGVSMFGGGSLLALIEYFPNGIIYGVDIEKLIIEHPRIHFYHGDAYKDEYFENIKFDFIIDDALHSPKHQYLLAKKLFPRVVQNGKYIIEDCSALHPDLHLLGKLEIVDLRTERAFDSCLICLTH